MTEVVQEVSPCTIDHPSRFIVAVRNTLNSPVGCCLSKLQSIYVYVVVAIAWVGRSVTE